MPILIGADGKREKLPFTIEQLKQNADQYIMRIHDEKGICKKIDKVNQSQNIGFSMSGFLTRDYEWNIKTRTLLQELEVEEKTFLIQDSLPISYDFQLTDETKTLLHYTVKKAIYNNGDFITVAWFSEDLPANFGPKHYMNLPGTVLEIENYDAENELTGVYQATKISTTFSKEKLKLKKGKIITKDEEKKLFEEWNERNKMMNSGLDKD